MLKQSGVVLVSFEWIVDSLSQYDILTVVPYLCETTVEEAQSFGLPPELLVEEELDDENEDEEMESS